MKHTRDGDPEAYRRLIERHQDHVARILWRFSRDRRTHEELVQDVFVEAYLSLGNYRGKAPFEHWLSSHRDPRRLSILEGEGPASQGRAV